MKVTFFKSTSLLMAILVFSLPFVSLAQNTTEMDHEIAAARAAGERDAIAEVSGASQALWFVFGALLGPLPILVAALEKPTPDAMRLAGKSPYYIAAYTAVYRTKIRSRKGISSGAGCLASTLALALLLNQAE